MYLAAEMHNSIHWIEVRLTTDGESAEALADVLGRFVSKGVVIESITRFNPRTEENEPTGGVAVVGYLAADEHLEGKRRQLEEALWHLGQITPIPQPDFTPIQDQNWMAAWQQHYHPVPLGEHILVMPAWIEPDQGESRNVVRIDPALAFGTGTHPSTQLCLRLLEQHLQPREAVIDVGCGSGILSIAALKLGAVHALAVDTDSQAVRATRENAAINQLSPEQLETGQGSVKEILAGQFSIQQAPLVVVNILAKVIINLLEGGLAGLVEQGDGTLLLSGILTDQVDNVLRTAQEAGFSLFEQLRDGDWVSLAMKKHNPHL